jgi:(1->4)-alpha-D-glucan 1-alpha-D-glucosylmutase
MAKGLEDTSFYIFNRLVSLNEVGGGPEWPKNATESFHRYNAERAAKWPYSMSPLSTHDTKRSEDVRARINVLSEMPAAWGEAVRRWIDLNAGHHKEFDGGPAPDANEEYLIYQTLIGAWPADMHAPDQSFVDRIKAYMVKALREAKVHSSWLIPNAEYDEAVQQFVELILNPDKSRAFLDDFCAFQKRVAIFGAFNSLSQTLLKLTAPGVPDTYQGTELLDFSLVDPDNRRPVDYAMRRSMLQVIREKGHAAAGELPGLAREMTSVTSVHSGAAKLYITNRALTTRRENPGLFTSGEYLPLTPQGPKAQHVFAFARRQKGVTAIIAVPRLLARLDTELPRDGFKPDRFAEVRLDLHGLGENVSWENVFSGAHVTGADGTIGCEELFAHFPVALLIKKP